MIQTITFEWKEDTQTNEWDYNMIVGDVAKTVGCVEKGNPKDNLFPYRWRGVVYLPRMVLTISSNNVYDCRDYVEEKVRICVARGEL